MSLRLQRAAGVRKQAEETSSLDCLAHPTLLSGIGSQPLTGIDLSVGREHASQIVHILVIDPRISFGVFAYDFDSASSCSSAGAWHGD